MLIRPIVLNQAYIDNLPPGWQQQICALATQIAPDQTSLPLRRVEAAKQRKPTNRGRANRPALSVFLEQTESLGKQRLSIRIGKRLRLPPSE